MQENFDQTVQDQAKEDSTGKIKQEIAAAARVSRRGGIISLIGGTVMVGALAAGAYVFTTDTQFSASGFERLVRTSLTEARVSRQTKMDKFAAIADKYEKHRKAVEELGDAGTGVITRWKELVRPENKFVEADALSQYNFELEEGEDLAATLSHVVNAKRLRELDDFNKSLANLRMTVESAEATYPWFDETYPTLSNYNPDWSTDPDNPAHATFLQSQMAWCRAIGASEPHGKTAD
ncbi:MAG: hypothetical protein OXQ29_15260 [Rhodospirillaceae bacterium]|nr:hypothetical protein [Rhodospirillaceae bacterium]